MRVGVDLHVLQGINQGSKTYLDNLFSQSVLKGAGIDFAFYFNKGGRVDSKWGESGDVCTFPFSSKAFRLTIGSAYCQVRDGLDLYHTQYIAPAFSKCRDVVTIHDILFETHPQFFTKSFVSRSRLLVRRSALKAAHIFTVSEFSRRALIELYGIDERKISLTPNGVNMDEFSVDASVARQAVQSKFGVVDYLLTVGRLEPRKNHLGLLRAYKDLLDTKKDIPPLLIVGQRDFGFDGIFKYISENSLGDTVKIVEGASFNDLVNLYAAAQCFVYPSFAEGFGIPPLEAMAAGVPVVCANNTSMAEIFRDSAVLIDPSNTGELASAIYSVITDTGLRKKFISDGRGLARRYSWEASAKSLLGAYKGVL